MKNLKYELLINGKKEVAYVNPEKLDTFLDKNANNFPVEIINTEAINQDLKLQKTSGLGKPLGTNQSQITPITTPKIDTESNLEGTSLESQSEIYTPPVNLKNVIESTTEFGYKDPNFSYDDDGHIEEPDDVEITEEEEEEEDLTKLSSVRDDKFFEILKKEFPNVDPNIVSFGALYGDKDYLNIIEASATGKEKRLAGYKWDPFGKHELDLGVNGGILMIQKKSRKQWEEEGNLETYENLAYLYRVINPHIRKEDIGPKGQYLPPTEGYVAPEIELEDGEKGFLEKLVEKRKKDKQEISKIKIEDDSLIEIKLQEKNQKGDIWNYHTFLDHKMSEQMEDFYEWLLGPDGAKKFGEKKIELDNVSEAFWQTEGGKSLSNDMVNEINKKFKGQLNKVRRNIIKSDEYQVYRDNLIKELLKEFPNGACDPEGNGINLYDTDCADKERMDQFNMQLSEPLIGGEIFDMYDNGLGEEIANFQYEFQMSDKRYLSYYNKNITPIIDEVAQNEFEGWAETWKLKGDYIDNDTLKIFEKTLAEEHNFFNPSNNAQVKAEMLKKFWQLRKRDTFGDLDSVSLAEAEKEFYAHFFDKLHMDPGKRNWWGAPTGAKNSHFYLKVVASDIGRWSKEMRTHNKNYKEVDSLALSNENWIGGSNGPRTTMQAIGNFHWVSNSKGTGGSWVYWGDISDNPNFARVNYGGGKTFKLDRNWKKNPELIKIYDRLIDQLVDSGYFTEDQVKLLENGEEITLSNKRYKPLNNPKFEGNPSYADRRSPKNFVFSMETLESEVARIWSHEVLGQLHQTDKFVKNVLEGRENFEDDASFVTEFWRGLTSLQGYEYVPFYAGYINNKDSGRVRTILEKDISGGKITDFENYLLLISSIKDQSQSLINDYATLSYKAGSSTGHSIRHLGEFFLGNPVSSVGRKFLLKGFQKSLIKNSKGALKIINGNIVPAGTSLAKTTADDITKGIFYNKTGKLLSLTTKQKSLSAAMNFTSSLAAISAIHTPISGFYNIKNTVNELMTPEFMAIMSLDDKGLSDLEIVTGYDEVGQEMGLKKVLTTFNQALRQAYGLQWAEVVTEKIVGHYINVWGGYAGRGTYRTVKNKLFKPGSVFSKMVKDEGFLMKMNIHYMTKSRNMRRFFNKFGDNIDITKALKQQFAYSGAIPEIIEELVNIPLQNWITGERGMAGIKKYGQFGEDMGMDWETLGIISMSSLFMKGGFNLMGGGATLIGGGRSVPSYEYKFKDYKTEEAMIAAIEAAIKNGTFKPSDDIYIRHDVGAFDNIRTLLKEKGFDSEQVKTPNLKKVNAEVISAQTDIIRNVEDGDAQHEQGNKKGDDMSAEDIISELDGIAEESKVLLNQPFNKNTRKQLIKLRKRRNQLIRASKKRLLNDKNSIFYKDRKLYNQTVKNVEQLMKEGEVENDVEMIETANVLEAEASFLESIGFKRNKKGDLVNLTTGKVQNEIKTEDGKVVNLEALIGKMQTAHGFFIPQFLLPKGTKQKLILNQELAITEKGANVAGHEFFHFYLDHILKSNPELKVALGSTFFDHLSKIDPRTIVDPEFRKRFNAYSTSSTAVQLEEAMAIYLDGIATGSIKYNESTMMKIGGVFKHITHQFGANLEINTGKQAHNFMVEFMKSVKRGKFSKGLLNSLKNEVLVGDQIKEIATNYAEGKKQDEIIKKKNLKNLINQFKRSAKEDGLSQDIINEIVSQFVQEEGPKGIKKDDDSIMFSQILVDFVENQNKNITPKQRKQRNKEITKEILELTELAKQTNPDITAKEVLNLPENKELKDELAKLNLGIIVERAKVAARVGKGLTLDEKRKVGFDQFLSGYTKEYNDLLNTYDPAVSDNFGTYAASTIRVRYNQILNNARNKLEQEGVSMVGMDVKTSEGVTQRQIAGETDRRVKDFEDQDLSLRTQIDVKKGKAALAPKLKFVRDQVGFTKETNNAISDVVKKTNYDVKGKVYEDVKKDIISQKPFKGSQTRNNVKPNGIAYDVIKSIAQNEYNVDPRSIIAAAQTLGVPESNGIRNKIVERMKEVGVKDFVKSIFPPLQYNRLTKKSLGVNKATQSKLYKDMDLRVPNIKGKALNVDNMTDDQIKAAFGINPDFTLMKHTRAFDPILKGTVVQTSVFAFNQAAREIQDAPAADIGIGRPGSAIVEGASDVMFSLRGDELTAQKLGQVHNKLNTKADVDNFVNDLVTIINKFEEKIGVGFITRNVAITSSTISDSKLKHYAKEQLEKLKEITKDRAAVYFYGKNKSDYVIAPNVPTALELAKEKTGNIKLKKSDIKKDDRFTRNKFDTSFIRKNQAKGIETLQKETKKLNDKNVGNFTKMWESVYDMVNEPNGKTLISPLLHWFKGSQDEGNHPNRIGAELLAIDTSVKGKLHFEHALQNAATYRLLMIAAVNAPNKKAFKKILETTKSQYKLIAMAKSDDNKLIATRLGNFMAVKKVNGKFVEAPWNIFENNWWERYFNEHVAAINGGINPNNFIDIMSQKSFAEMFNINSDGGIRMSKSADFIQSQSNLNQAFLNQVKFSMTGKTQGMSTFDFDDTLAFTKSGVRVTMPNTDGKPKPKRKVIFLAGGAGSGKGNVIKKLGLEKSGFKIVNSDISLEWLKKNHGLPEDMRELTPEQRSTLGKLGHQARKIAKDKMMKYQGNANGVVIDGTGGSMKTMEKLVNEFKDKGYDVSMMFVDTSLEVALDRNKKRKERSLLSIIVRRNHEAVQKNKPGFKEMFGNRFMEVNTDKMTMDSPMPSSLVKQMDNFVSSYEKLRIDATEFAEQGDMILEKGGEFDFSEFNKVVDGKPGPLLDKAKARAKKYGTKDMFVLTARTQQSAKAIHQFLQSQGLDIPIGNITGLANSTANAKAEWFLQKFAEGYNDMYFVDDALANVEAVKKVLNQLDVKSDVVQAGVKFSQTASDDFNNMLERTQGVDAKKVFSYAEARKRGAQPNVIRSIKSLYIPPSAEDFKGLMYYFLGKGKQGEQDLKFFADNLFVPFAKGIRAWNTYKQSMVNDYKTLKKNFPKIKLNKKIPGTNFTNDTAIRVYLWDKHGFNIPGISKTLQSKLIAHVSGNQDLKRFANGLSKITKRKEGYVKPSENWMVESVSTDLRNTVDKIGRKEFLSEWINNKDIIFSKENMNKIRAIYGDNFVEALDNILYRMENGGNRRVSPDKNTNRLVNWINDSVGAIMFFNMRSAILQTISTVNFINWGDNNMFKASKAFANQPRFWKDFAMLFNSDQLKQRRAGLQIDVSASELTKSFAEGGYNPKTVINYLLQVGFKPTQIADSFAIAFGGASFYRNRYNTYIKKGMSEVEANKQAMLDFQEVAEETQQSSREDLVSQQQASPLGRIILAFQNVTMQMGRLTKKGLSDIVNGRGDMKTNVSKVIYYGVVQNIVFASLQSALAMIMWGDDEEEIEDRTIRASNQALDSFLRGTGLYGAAVSTLKNIIIQWDIQSKKGYGQQDASKIALEAINLSPPIGSKVRKIVNAFKTIQYNKGVSEELGWRVENPKLHAAFSVIEGLTNIPLERAIRKANNIEEAITGDHLMWQRIAMLSGWNHWSIGVKDEELEEAKSEAKRKRKEKKKKKNQTPVPATEIEVLEDQIKDDKNSVEVVEGAVKTEEVKKEEKEEKEKVEEKEKKPKKVRCSGTNSQGKRCGMTMETTDKKWKCVHHKEFKEGSDTDGDGLKEYRCTATKTNGQRCKNKTENKNKKCYAHQ